MSDFANVMGNDKDEFARLLMKEHRTIQQDIFGLIQKCIVAWATQEDWDAKNEHTIMACRNLLEAFPDLETRTPPRI